MVGTYMCVYSSVTDAVIDMQDIPSHSELYNYVIARS